MRLDIRGRQRGKTQAMLEWLLETPDAFMVVATEERRRDVVNRVSEEDRPKVIQRILVPDQAARLRTGVSGRIGVDQADHVLQNLLSPHRELAYVTMDTPDQVMYSDDKPNPEEGS